MRPRPLSARELPNFPEVLLGIAALLVIIVGASLHDAFVVLMGLLMGGGALVSMGFAESPVTKSMFSFLTLSACFGVLLVVRWLQLLAQGPSRPWETWVILIAGLLALLAAYRAVLLHRY